MNEQVESTPPSIEKLLEAMRLPEVPNDADEFSPGALASIAGWKKLYTAAIVAGLMTEVKYQVNAIRLDWLQRLVLSRAEGHEKPSRSEIGAILNTAFNETRVTRLEDPIEDLFCDVVPTSRGDRLIFDGHWEHAAPYTDTIIQAFEHLGDHPVKRTALDAVDAVLRLSDALVKRSGIGRHAYQADEPWQNISLPSADRLKALARRVRFTSTDLEKLGIAREALSPFILEPGQFSHIGSELVGNSPLERHPLIALDNGILVAHPGAISLAARAVMLQTAKRGGVANAFLENLAIAQEDYSEWSGFWPTRELRLSRPDGHGLSASVCAFAPGRYQHVIQVCISLENFPASAFGGFTPLSEEVSNAIRDDISKFWEFLESQPDYREAITVLLLCGWGAGVSISLPINDEEAPRGWRFQHLSFADAAQLGACEDGKLKHLWRITEQVELMEGLGYSVSNVNGTINLFGNWRETKGQFVPEHMVDMEPPCSVMIPIDELFKPRLEAAQSRDLRALPFSDGSFKRVQRIEWGQDGAVKPIYGSLEDVAAQRLMGAVAVADQVWWIETVQDESKPVSFDWQYQVWNAVMQWLAAVAPQIAADFCGRLPIAARYVRLVIGGENPEERDDAAFEAEPEKHLEARHLPDDAAAVIVQRNWMNTLRRPNNDGEIALIAMVLQQLLASPQNQLSREEILASIRRALPSADWRWLHAHSANTLMERLSASGLTGSFKEIPLSAVALVKCGSIWRFRNRADGYEFTTEHQCRDFLKAYYDFVLGELIAHIKTFDRAKLVAASASRYQAARGEQRLWRKTIRALRTIRGDEAADQTALERQSAMNAVQRAAKIICEIAACEAPETGGAEPGLEDLDELYARALLIFGNGQLWASIRAGVVKPHLKISPAGDLLSDRSIFEKTFVPATVKLNTKTLDQAAASYARRGPASPNEKLPEKLPWSDGLRQAIEAEFGCSAEAFVDFQFAVMQLAEKRRRGVLLMRRSKLHALLVQNEDYPKCDPGKLLERLTLERRNSWTTPMEGALPRDLDLSRFDRRNSLINRPLLAISDEADPMLLIAPAIVHDATNYVIGNLHEGSLHNDFWSSAEARAYAGTRADELGREFEDDVAEKLNSAGVSAWPRRSVTGLLERATEADMGDVDVLAVSRDKQTVWVIEAKNLRLCRTETEVASRMSEYRGATRTDGKGKEKPDKMLRHLRRVRYLRENAALLGERLGLSLTPIVRGMMVVDAPQPMNFHVMEQHEDAACCMLDDLQSVVGLRTAA